ncbi:MAG: hypothetical protein ABIS49_13815 [Aestuariivirga sp.]
MKSIFRFVVALAGLNLIWEIGQLPFYTLWSDGNWQVIGYAVVHCTAGDILIALASIVPVLALRSWRWPLPGRQSAIFLVRFIAIGVAYTVFSEWYNIAIRKSWSYSDLMPVIPLLGTGVTPLLQWVVVPALAFWLCSSATAMLYKSAEH